MDILPLIKPRSIAVIGASRDIKKIGAQIVHNLVKAGFEGTLYPINTKAETVQGIKAYSSISEIAGDIDLAVIAIPKQFVKDVIRECIVQKVKSICVISAGFKEVDEEGARLEHDIAHACKNAGIPLLGPNCLGIINTTHKVNASFTAQMPLAGNISFISQSGAFGTAAIDWANAHNVGFNVCVSLGNKAMLNENHFLQSIQPDTKVVAMYLESISNGEQFLDIATTIGQTTPIVLLKPGKSKDAQNAAKSHTGSLTGADSVVSTACKQAGIIRANDSQELFDLMKAFSFLSELKGNRIAIITNAGGPSIMATDTLEECGLQLAPLSEQTQKTLSQYLPREANIHDPVDLIGDAKADRYDHALDAVLQEKNVDACVVLLTPQSSTEIELTAQHIIKHAQSKGKPVVASFIGGAHIEKAVHILNTHNIPCYEYPEQAVRTLGRMWEYYKSKERLQLSPNHTTATFISSSNRNNIIDNVKKNSRSFLLQDEIEDLLKEANIVFPKRKIVSSPEDAFDRAREIGTPVVMKIASPNIIHKTDAHAVALNLHDEDEIADTFIRLQKINERYGNQGYVYIQKQLPKSLELLIGIKKDPIFGPVIVFGSGGIYTEIFKDTSSRITPLTRNAAIDMIQETKIAKILNGYRGDHPYDISKLVQMLMGLANLAKTYKEISEIDINPLVFADDLPVALDARVILEK